MQSRKTYFKEAVSASRGNSVFSRQNRVVIVFWLPTPLSPGWRWCQLTSCLGQLAKTVSVPMLIFPVRWRTVSQVVEAVFSESRLECWCFHGQSGWMKQIQLKSNFDCGFLYFICESPVHGRLKCRRNTALCEIPVTVVAVNSIPLDTWVPLFLLGRGGLDQPLPLARFRIYPSGCNSLKRNRFDSH